MQQIKELLIVYEKLKNGERNSYLEEEAFETICDYFEEQENLQKALEVIKLGVKTFPFSADLKIRQADILLSFHQILEAEKLLDNAYIFDTSNIDYYILKIEIFVRRKEIDKAEKFLEEAILKFNKEDQIEILEASVEIFDEYFAHEKITNYLIKILKIDPNNDFSLKEISFWPQISNQIEEVIDFHQELINENTYNHLLWFNLGIFYQHLGLYEKAIESYEYCLAIEENFEYGLKNLSIVLLATKKYADAILILENLSIKLERPESFIYAMLALAHCGIKKYPKAIHYYKAAISLNKENNDLYYLLCQTLFKDKKYLEAIEYIKKISIVKTKYQFYNELLGDCYFELKQFKNALACYFNCIVIKKNNKKIWIKYLKCFIYTNQYSIGIEKSDLAFSILNNPIFVLFKIGFYVLNEEIDVAKKCFEQHSNIKISRKIFEYFPLLKNQGWFISYNNK